MLSGRSYTVSLPANQSDFPGERHRRRTEVSAVSRHVVEPGDIVYIVGYFDALPGTIFSTDKARDGMVSAVKGTLLNETAISLSGYAGRELNISTKLGTDEPTAGTKAEGVEYLDRARFYEVEKRVYVLQLLAPKSLGVRS